MGWWGPWAYKDLGDCGISLFHRAVDFVHKLGSVLSEALLRCSIPKTIQCPHSVSVRGRLRPSSMTGGTLVDLVIEGLGTVEVRPIDESYVSLQHLELHARVCFAIEAKVGFYGLKAVVVGHSSLVTLRDCLSRSSRY